MSEKICFQVRKNFPQGRRKVFHRLWETMWKVWEIRRIREKIRARKSTFPGILPNKSGDFCLLGDVEKRRKRSENPGKTGIFPAEKGLKTVDVWEKRAGKGDVSVMIENSCGIPAGNLPESPP